MTKTNEEKLKNLFWTIMDLDGNIDHIIDLHNYSEIDPFLVFDDEEDPLNIPAIEQCKKLDQCFEETIDVLEKRRDDMIDEFYNLMGWKPIDREKSQKFCDAVISAVVGAMVIETLCEPKEDDRGSEE